MDDSLHATMQHQDDKPISANSLLEQIKAGSERWLMPWHKGLEAPTNPVTGNLFKGRNADLLWKAAIQKGVSHNQWATLKQWRKLKGKVRIRSKGTRIFKPKTFESMDLFGKETPILTGFNSYYVFNEQDIDNYNPEHPDLFTAHKHYVTDHDALNQLIEKSQAFIHYGGHRAVYFPASDEIFMPKRSSFVSTARATANESFYSTLLHELVHWTGHHSRLARGVYFGVSELDYAYEELIAELGAVILCGDFGVHLAPKQENAAYLRSWLKVLEHDIDNFYNAFESAQKAVNWLYLHTGVYPKSKSQEPDQETEPAEPPITSKKPVRAKFTRILSYPSGPIAIQFSVAVTCGNCNEEYRVTLQRYEERSMCPDCERVNLHDGLWV